jgi:hypothetical protein
MWHSAAHTLPNTVVLARIVTARFAPHDLNDPSCVPSGVTVGDRGAVLIRRF